MSAERLDPLVFPLRGPRLIEASAGTGKTFTIAALYVRLVLGHGDEDSRFPIPLLPPQILVVTFTNAATRELRDRIRNRLAEAARLFRGQIDSDDPFLTDLLAQPEYAEDASRALAARRLEDAAEWMDEAAIYTIHGWCQRMLTQHAFDTGSLFRQTLEQDDGELLAEMARDYWRTFCYPLSTEAAEALQSQAKVSEPDGLRRWIGPLLDRPREAVHYQGEPLGDGQSPADFDRQLQAWLPEYRALGERARELWRTDREALESLLREAVRSKDLNNNSYSPKTLGEKLEKMAAWADGDAEVKPELEKFTADALASKTSKKGTTPEHPVFEALQAFLDYSETRPALHGVRLHAARWVQSRFERSRLRAAQMGFDDMLKRLDSALDGEGGERLARVIREQYPVAMIDEFQDTDPVQYRILRRVYGVSDRDDAALLMIGDPKQAIYAFRGADIHTYLQARQDIGERHYTLGRNFRSTAPLVDAVNRLFLSAEQDHPEEGAFLFGRGDDNPLPFLPVDAQGRREWLEVDSSRPTALTAWLLEPDDPDAAGVGTAEYRDRMAAHSADEIVRLLNLAAEDRAGFRDGDGGWRPLRPADIAILVRSGTEAELVRGALEQRRVRSVYLSDRESVYDSPEALDLWRWLRACAEPEQVRYVHGALATATLGLDYRELAALNRDERLLEEQVGLFRDLHHCWQRRGVLATVRRLLDHFQLPARLLAQPGGERALTNILHLAELLQTAGARVEGELALIRFLQERIGGTDREADEQVVRLESDADLVQVVTIHKAKGLQYPLVLVPFPCAARSVKKDDGSFSFQSPDAGNVVELDTQHTPALEAAERERLQEDLRLLYVALTRPMHACWLGVAAVYSGRSPNLHNSALGQLLGCREKTDTGQLAARLQPLARDGAIAVDTPPPVSTTVLQMGDRGADLSPAARCREPVNRDHWWIASYSALRETVAGSGDTTPDARAAPVPESAREAIALETGAEPARAHPRAGDDIHLFPRGAAAGTFLHDLLEWAADEGLARAAADADLRRQFLEPRCHSGHWQGQATLLDRWLSALLTTPLPLDGDPIALADLTSYQPEMEFWFAVADTPVATIDQRVQQAVAPGQARPTLLPGRLGGMMKGFVDLVFEHGGRYWVADYKSNWLGPEDASYSADAMREAVLDKRYDVQYAIYLLALHRLLKARLPGYADDPAAGYERHVGGALYLFLRGIDEPTQHGCYVDKPPAEQIVALDDLLAGREVHHE